MTEADLTLKVIPRYPDETSNLNLAWRILDVERENLRIQIDFEDPTEVSKYLEQDQLSLEFKNTSLFVGERKGALLANSSLVISKKIPRQLVNDLITFVMVKVNKGFTVTTAVIMTTALVFSTILTAFLNLMIGLVSSLQLVIIHVCFQVCFP